MMVAKKKNELAIIVAKSGLDEVKSAYVLKKFSEYSEIAAKWSEIAKTVKVTSAEQRSDMQMARVGRLELKTLRVALEKGRKAMKEDCLREGRAVDMVASFLKGLIEPIEKYLDEQEHFVENQEKARLEAIRIEEEKKAEAERVEREKIEADLRKKNFEAAEQVRLAREAQARQEAESQRLVNEAREKERAAEQARLDAELRLVEERERAERDKVAAEKRAADAKAKAESDAKIMKAQVERDKAAAEAKLKEAERRAQSTASAGKVDWRLLLIDLLDALGYKKLNYFDDVEAFTRQIISDEKAFKNI